MGVKEVSVLTISVPTPTVTDALNVAWAPSAPNKNRLLRIGDKLALEDNYKEDILKYESFFIFIFKTLIFLYKLISIFRFWNNDIPNLFKKKETSKKGSKDEL